MSVLPELSHMLDALAYRSEDREGRSIWATFERQMEQLGVKSVHYESGVPRTGAAEFCLKSVNAARPAHGDLVCSGFMEAVRDNPEFHDADGFVRHCEASVVPILYDASATDILPKSMLGVNNLARDFGATGGVIVPLRGFGSPTFGNVTYIMDQHSPMQPEAMPVAELTALAHILHGSLETAYGVAVRTSPDDVDLTRQERACLTYVAQGYGTKQLAHVLGISDATANEHIRNACRKLETTTRAGAAARAVALGLIEI